MTATMILYGSLNGLIDNRRLSAGTIDTPFSFTVKGLRHEETVSVAHAANAVIYDNSIGAFNTCAIECDYNTRVVLRDTGGNKFSIGLRGTGKAGKYGDPFKLTLGNTNTSVTTINSIQVYNQSGSTAKVHIVVVK